MRLDRGTAAAALMLCLVASGCAAPGFSGCAGKPAILDSLYFGTGTPDGSVSASDWAGFLAAEVTPRFPEGFTVLPGIGQWRSADGSIGSEASYVLQVAHPSDATSDSSVEAIAEGYKRQFHQQAVLRVTTPACMWW
jgi:hypothetical protein